MLFLHIEHSSSSIPRLDDAKQVKKTHTKGDRNHVNKLQSLIHNNYTQTITQHQVDPHGHARVKSQKITKVMRIHPLGNMDICTKFHANPSNSC